VVQTSNGEIGFSTKEATKKYGYKTEKYETYEESLAILRDECEHLSN
jgi:abortive infection bacteriophage resistance protein